MKNWREFGIALISATAICSSAWAGAGPTGHGHDGSFSAGEPGDAKKPARIVQVTMSESDGKMTFTPDKVEVRKDEQIKFVIKNSGTLDHEFFLDSFEKNAAHKIEMQKNPEMEHDDPNAVRLASGKQTEILWKFSTAGTFEFACLIPGHYEAGMHGKVVVK